MPACTTVTSTQIDRFTLFELIRRGINTHPTDFELADTP